MKTVTCSDCGKDFGAQIEDRRSAGVQYDQDLPWLCKTCDAKRAG